MDTGIALIQSSRVSKHARPSSLISAESGGGSLPGEAKSISASNLPISDQFCSGCGIGAEMTYHLPHLKPYPIKPDKGHQRTKSIWSCHRWLNLRLNLLRLWLRWCCSLAHNSIYLFVSIWSKYEWWRWSGFLASSTNCLNISFHLSWKSCVSIEPICCLLRLRFSRPTRSAVQQPKISSESQQSVCRAWHVCVSLCYLDRFPQFSNFP